MTSIGPSITIHGEISSSEDLLIGGRVKGQIVMREGALTIGPSAHVDADVRGRCVTLLGRVKGHVSATERVEVGTSADVTGTVSANFVALADGARFNGRIDMDQRTIAAKVATYQREARQDAAR